MEGYWEQKSIAAEAEVARLRRKLDRMQVARQIVVTGDPTLDALLYVAMLFTLSFFPPLTFVIVVVALLWFSATKAFPALSKRFAISKRVTPLLTIFAVIALIQWLAYRQVDGLRSQVDSAPKRIITQLMGNMPQQARNEVAHLVDTDDMISPQIRLQVDRFRTGQSLDAGYSVNDSATILDGKFLHDFTVSNVKLIYRGGPLDIENVQFVNCKTDFSQAPQANQEILQALVSGKIHELYLR